jgi:hypothetical protein
MIFNFYSLLLILPRKTSEIWLSVLKSIAPLPFSLGERLLNSVMKRGKYCSGSRGCEHTPALLKIMLVRVIQRGLNSNKRGTKSFLPLVPSELEFREGLQEAMRRKIQF